MFILISDKAANVKLNAPRALAAAISRSKIAGWLPHAGA
jgi:hypothetical protein